MHYYQFHIGDYRSATGHLSNDEDLAYRRLLDMYYDSEQPIPLETHWVARRIRMDIEVVETVLNDMFQRTENGWRNGRCDSHIAEYHARAERNRVNGKGGGRPKTAKKNPVGSQPQPSDNPVVSLTINQETNKPENQKEKTTQKRKSIERPENVSEQVWSDFLSQRKQLKADLTVTALEGIKREADKIGWSLEQVLVECTVRGWRGFKADWIKEKTDGSSNRTGGVDRRSSLARAIDEGLDLLG